MKKALITALAMSALLPVAALAQERAGDAALGAVSGAIVLGPIGAVAGALVGYTAGPSIARSWRSHGSRSAAHRQRPQRQAGGAASAAPASRTREAMDASAQTRTAGSQPIQAAPAASQPASLPPVQGFE